MRISFWLWLITFILTILTAAYQRMTGPTYPISGNITIDGKVISYSLDRSHGGNEDHLIKIQTDDPDISGLLQWKRYKTNDNWRTDSLIYTDGFLTGSLPYQPPAGKLLYRVSLVKNENTFLLNKGNQVIIRYKDDVPVFIIVPHIILMFLAMLLSTRTGLEFFNKKPDYKKLVYWTLGVLLLGGMVFGPIMQKYAFGEFWTGIPFGFDLTDNKTLLAVIGWIIALAALKKSAKPQRWIIFASIFMFIIYLIPHSVLGSELDYNELDKQQNKIEQGVE
ncbi:MAG: hypothetical protein RBR74_02305 [Ignavibacteriaceae bacterium]|jgi:hypothetical protein|nr:hypothetical protein [Ignavibacteriaceae bacterium]